MDHNQKNLKKQLAQLRRHRKTLLKLAESLLDVAEAGGAVSRECITVMWRAKETIEDIKRDIRYAKPVAAAKE